MLIKAHRFDERVNDWHKHRGPILTCQREKVGATKFPVPQTLARVCTRARTLGQQQIHGCPGGPSVLIMQGSAGGGCSLRYNTSAAAENFKMIFVLLAHSPINLLHCYYAGAGGERSPGSRHLFFKVNSHIFWVGRFKDNAGWEIA